MDSFISFIIIYWETKNILCQWYATHPEDKV